MGKNDLFAEIAAGGTAVLREGMEVPGPERIVEKALPFWEDVRAVRLPERMGTGEELKEELERRKEYYKPFLRNLAPRMEEVKRRRYLKEFDWRVETEGDRKNRRGVLEGEGVWERVRIPHYGPPLGKAAAYYRMQMEFDGVGADEALFLHFDGVDYKAEVTVNGGFAGGHEGFFAPFECEITPWIRDGSNVILIRVENDFVQKRNEVRAEGELFGGDKIYAATGPGYDEPQMGWHHCPPGMGIWQAVYLEVRRRCFLQDIFVRPLPEEKRAEVWLEVFKCDAGYEKVSAEISVYGRNFEGTVAEKLTYVPETEIAVGLGDTYTEAQLKLSGGGHSKLPLYMEKGVNYLTIPVSMGDFRRWQPDAPYLYEVQAVLKGADGTVLDRGKQSFGMRSFHMDTDCEPKGMFYLNGKKIRLRGANTMGHEQRCVMMGDREQLLEDLLLAKICNMNFLRLTQRPVQEEVYEYCDMVGLLTQTDLPLFGVLRRNMVAEALRQAVEMEHLVRRHPCNILVSYINEPFPNAYNQPHRHLDRKGLEDFFTCADRLVRMENPERVVKHVDGDYDPPDDTLPDNHCYTCWYNGHGVSLGELHRGYWLPVKKGWNYGCGEYGAEGMDTVAVMRRHYPAGWLPEGGEEEKVWSPERISYSQTGNFHYFFFPTQDTLAGWAEQSRRHQAWAAKWMTEAFRRDRRMVSSAIHLFIDAFPAGWMKAIMDVERNPKPAYFAYRDALEPLMASLRTDRYGFYAGERVSIEVWECNDRPDAVMDAVLYYEVSRDEILLYQGDSRMDIGGCTSQYQGSIVFTAQEAGIYTIRTMLSGPDGKILHRNQEQVKVWPRVRAAKMCVRQMEPFPAGVQLMEPANAGVQQMEPFKTGVWISEADAKAGELLRELDIHSACIPAGAQVLLFGEYQCYDALRAEADMAIQNGARAVFLELDEGSYLLGDACVKVKESGMLPMNFAAVNSEHPLMEGFAQEDFRNWYDPGQDMIVPFLDKTFTSEGFLPALTGGNTDDRGIWGPALAVGTHPYGKGMVVLCQLELKGRTGTNPAAGVLARRMLGLN